MRFAYADPPYLGCCDKYDHFHGETGRCWDDLETHEVLIDQLCAEFDGWALSCHEPSLHLLRAMCPKGTRTGVWLKTFASFKPNVNPGYCWEPVLWYGHRDHDRYDATIRDFLIAPITLQKGLTGAKPRKFAFWIFDLLNADRGDELVDYFPGTGIIGDCWDDFCGRERPIQEGMLA